jgi:hypothetical protein
VGAAFASVNEALSLLYQVAGPLHREVANASALLALVLWHAGERTSAVAQQARAVELLERLLGPDHVDVAHAHGNLAAYLAELCATNAALRHMQRAIFCLQPSILALEPPPPHTRSPPRTPRVLSSSPGPGTRALMLARSPRVFIYPFFLPPRASAVCVCVCARAPLYARLTENTSNRGGA